MGKEKKRRREALEESTIEIGNEEKKQRKEANDESTLDATRSEEKKSYEDKLQCVSVIAKPIAQRKLAKKLYKLIRKASKHKTFLRNGLKDVQSRIRKGETGLVVFAGDVTPIEIMCHLPAVCEEKKLPYVYTPSREDIGAAMGVKRGSLMVMIRFHEDYQELYEECIKEIQKLPIPLY